MSGDLQIPHPLHSLRTLFGRASSRSSKKARSRSRITAFFTLTGLALGGLGGCADSAPPMVEGFVLPEGDIAAGRQVFVRHDCQQCHLVDDPALPAYAGEREYEIRLGGEVLRVQNYGDLLTSVVLPDHRLSQAKQLKDAEGNRPENSPMPNLTGNLTVAELIDLVSYLHAQYSESQSAYKGYSYVR